MNSCHSCGMPLDEKSKSKHADNYCAYCQNQDTAELSSYEEVRTGSINAAVKLMGKSEEEATKMADEMLPKLPRWENLEK
ncbi:zinc ribbon domain-containing protein [Patescibacteria group bacterium]